MLACAASTAFATEPPATTRYMTGTGGPARRSDARRWTDWCSWLLRMAANFSSLSNSTIMRREPSEPWSSRRETNPSNLDIIPLDSATHALNSSPRPGFMLTSSIAITIGVTGDTPHNCVWHRACGRHVGYGRVWTASGSCYPSGWRPRAHQFGGVGHGRTESAAGRSTARTMRYCLRPRHTYTNRPAAPLHGKRAGGGIRRPGARAGLEGVAE